VDLTLSAGLADREHAFGEAEPFAAVAAERDFALDDGFPERSFSGVACWLYSLGAEECPERRPAADEIPGECASPPVQGPLTASEQAAKAGTERFQCESKLSLRELFLAVAAPCGKEPLAFGDTDVSEWCTRASGICHALEVSHEVSPAELSPLEWVAVVGTPAVGGDDPWWISAKPRLTLASGAASGNPKVGGRGGYCSPHPASLGT